MHHQLPNRKRTLNLLLQKVSGSGKICVLSQIEPQIPHLVVVFRQFLQVLVLQLYYPQIVKPFNFFGAESNTPSAETESFKAYNKTVSDHRLSIHFLSWPIEQRLSLAFAPVGPCWIILFHLSSANTRNHTLSYNALTLRLDIVPCCAI